MKGEREQMDCEAAIAALKELRSEKHKANAVRLGIPEEDSFGVSTSDIRRLAKILGKSHSLACQLWSTGYHEAKLLAVLLFDSKEMSLEMAAELMEDVFSWDLCDHICKNLFIKIQGYDRLVDQWCRSDELYCKRAAFTLMAAIAMQDKEVPDENLDVFLEIVKKNSDDAREHVKKAISWALREIGKRDFAYREKAILLAHELMKTGCKAQVWIGRDALKELERLVKVEGRRRLISSISQMGDSA